MQREDITQNLVRKKKPLGSQGEVWIARRDSWDLPGLPVSFLNILSGVPLSISELSERPLAVLPGPRWPPGDPSGLDKSRATAGGRDDLRDSP